jgi:hypothetical protein
MQRSDDFVSGPFSIVVCRDLAVKGGIELPAEEEEEERTSFSVSNVRRLSRACLGKYRPFL